MLLTSGSFRLTRAIALLAIAVVNLSSLASARQPATPVRDVPPESARTLTAAPDTVPIRPAARDEQIQQRLQDVLVATGWFTEPGVRVEEGVVFLSGDAESEDLRLWAGEVARKTEGVVAVANRMELAQPSPGDLSGFGPEVNRTTRHVRGGRAAPDFRPRCQQTSDWPACASPASTTGDVVGEFSGGIRENDFDPAIELPASRRLIAGNRELFAPTRGVYATAVSSTTLERLGHRVRALT